ncbi:hypothetical protein [Sulfitobacter sp. R18_1]|uniref:hypothetical protein n=1 Tax=Sulfitobacter sp. R18_1 TaxID=2821104 RepID=UPI001ADB94B2|nr:hypothetical protein [Sulfitobacter sp. R18_1]MBO9428112.1 hypothetical protein [Sulfitobacter sp. R18_1]
MSDKRLKDRLREAKGANSGLCREAEDQIRSLEQILIDIETHLMFPGSPQHSLKEPMLKTVQRGLYSPEAFAGFYPEEGDDETQENGMKP